MPRFVPLLLASLVVAACSSDDSKNTPNADAPTKEQAEALATKYCEGVAMKLEPCFDEEERKEAAECNTKEGICAAYRLLPGVIDNLVECNKQVTYKVDAEFGRCFSEPEDKGGDYCFFEAAKAMPADPAYDAYATKCYAKYSECGTGDGRFSNDYCDLRVKLYVRDYDKLAECFSEPCEKDVIKACIRAKLDQGYKEAGVPDSCFL